MRTKLVNLEKASDGFRPPPLEQIQSLQPKQTKFGTLVGNKLKDFIGKLQLDCPDKYKDKYIGLCVKYHDVFSKDEFDLGFTDRISHRIKLKHNNPIHQKQFKIPLATPIGDTRVRQRI